MYDEVGNTIQEVRTISAASETWHYIYNSAGRMVEVKLNGSTQAKYKYDWRGLQVVRSDFSSGTEVRTVSQFDVDGRRIAEYDVDIVSGAHTRLREYIWLDDYPIAVVEANGDVFYVHFDQINRPIQATNDNEDIVWQVRYDAFGAINVVLADTGALSEMNLRFPGQWYQAETGNHQNWHRDYDPTLGRYLEADPLGLIDGSSVYGYAMQSPVRYTDPTGEVSLDAVLCFHKNFQDMKDASTRGADKYFHCKANCCATRKSSRQCAEDLSQFREDTDDFRKGPNPEDRRADEAANEAGRRGGEHRRLQSCRTVCFQYRPRGLPERY